MTWVREQVAAGVDHYLELVDPMLHRLPGQAEAGPDPAIVRCFAAVAVRSFIARIACALMHPAGVEMLQVLVGYVTDLGFPVGWLVITGDAEFFAVTKRLHNQIHGDPAGGPLGAAEAHHNPRVAPAGISAAASSAEVTLLAIVLDPDRSATPQTRPEIRRTGTAPADAEPHVG